MKLVTLFLVLVALPSMVTAYNILILMAFGSRSHKNALDPIAAELGRKGHQVTIMSSIDDTAKNISGVTNVYLPKVAQALGEVNFFESRADQVAFFKRVINTMYDTCNATYQEPSIKDLIRNPTGRYDVVLLDGGFNDFLLPLAHHMGLPVVYVMAAQLMSQIAWNLNIPFPYSYIPLMGTYYTNNMTFMQRAATALVNPTFIAVRNHFFGPWLDKLIKEQVLPKAPPMMKLENQVAFMLTNSHPAVSHVTPSMPYLVEVGCLHCVEAKALPKELEDFFQSSGQDGVIYFSMGSVTKGVGMPLDMRDKMVAAFGRLPQKVLWKYESPIDDLPKNILLTKWAPQQDILAHPKTRLFITHGGGLSTMEAAYHGCPVLGFPLSADQESNMANARKLGFGEHLDWGDFTEDDLLEKLHGIFDNQRYKKRATELSALLRDQPQPPVERAVYWVEYVIRHKGAPHLKSGAEHLNFFQYFLVDVIAVAVLVTLATVSLVCWVLTKLCKLLFGQQSKDKKLKTN